MHIQGACHCGNIRFQLEWEPEPGEIPARVCDCSFCRKHGGVWTSCPGGRLNVELAQPSRVSHYAFGTRTADFHICSICGVVPLVTSTIDGTTYAVVNVNTFEQPEGLPLRSVPASFSGEDEPARLARRVRGWIPHVQVRRSEQA